MNVILKISVRNLVRQKRRNLLLGMSIAFGMGVLVMVNAIGTGFVDLIINKMVERISGHILVNMSEKDHKEWKIIRDKERIKQVILKNIDGVKVIHERVGAHGKAIGNGKAMYAVVFGIEPDEAFYHETAVVAGNLTDLANSAIEHPVVLSKVMADKLNVRVNDVIRMKFQTVFGQVQTARFTVVAVMKADNPFLNTLIYCHLKYLKPLMGYQEHETKELSVILKHLSNPQRSIKQANRLHKALHPGVAGYRGIVERGTSSNAAQNDMLEVNVLAVSPDEESRKIFAALLQLADGSLEDTFENEETVIMSDTTAEALSVSVGDEVTMSYDTRFEGRGSPESYRVGAIFRVNELIEPDMIFVHPDRMYATAFQSPPQHSVNVPGESVLFPVLLKEWILLERTLNDRASAQKYRELSLSGWRGAILDVQTVHEVVSDALEIADVLTIITFVGVFILFFVIQIGVVNLLRTTIRERTREIGTIRAIGMQRGDVRWCFVTEVLLLTVFACLAGIVLAFILMKIFSTISIDAGGQDLGAFLVNQHLYFVTRMGDLVTHFVIILGIAFLTAYFPARKAANLSVTDALRHYE